MTTRSLAPASTHALCQAIADQEYGRSLKLLQQLPLRNRWQTLFLLNRTLSNRAPKDYLRALFHDLLYRAYREEYNGNDAEASRLYRLLIQHNGGRIVTQKARQGYQRIANGAPKNQYVPRPKPSASSATIPTQALPTIPTQALPTIPDHETSMILLQPVPSSEKQELAVKLAAILKLDPYTARLTLPSLEFRILRHGLASNMERLHQSLNTEGLTNSHISLNAIQSIPVYDVLYIEAIDDNLVVQVRDRDLPGQSIPMVLNWTDIQQSVDALLPLFEDVIKLNTKRKIVRQTTTQDHSQIIDLHLRNRQGILRFYDAGYQFNQGISLVATETAQASLDTKTSWAQWQGLKKLFATHLPPILEHHKFDSFAANAVEQIELLTKIKAHIHLLRRHECYWDQAFHLYSALHYLQLV